MPQQQPDPAKHPGPPEPAPAPESPTGLAATVARLQSQITALREGADVRALVELAKGVLVERLNCGPAEAGQQLARLAAGTRQALPEIAADIVNQSARDTIADATAWQAAHAQPEAAAVRLRTTESAALLAGDDMQAVVRAVLDLALSPLGTTAVAVWAASPDGSLTLAGEAGFGPAEAARWRYIPPGVGAPAQQALAADRLIWVPESGDPPPPTIGRGTDGIRAVLPVQTHQRQLGALEIRWPGEPEAPEATPALARQLDALAELCAISLNGRGTGTPGPPGGPTAWLTDLVDGLLDSTMLLRPLRDRDGRITDFQIVHINERFDDPAGRPRSSLTGLPLLAAYPQFAGDGGLSEHIHRVYATGVPYQSENTVLDVRADRIPPAAVACVGLSRFANAVLLSWRLKEGNARLAALPWHAQRLNRIGSFEENLVTGEIIWNEPLYTLYGLPPDADPVPLHRVARHAHPDDAAAVDRFVHTVLQDHEDHTVTFRLPRPDGVVRHLRLIAEPVCDASGVLIAVRGAYQDVSLQHWTEVALAATRDQLVGAELQAAHRRRLARDLQQAILPPADDPVHTAGLRVAVRYRPAENDHRVGGDWYDAVLLPTRQVLIAVGDVVGHGISAATGMVTLRHALRGLAITGASPAQLLHWLNGVAHDLTDHVTATAVCGLFDPDTHTLLWARAGHLPPVLVRQGSAEVLQPPEGLILGVLDDSAYEESELILKPQDTLLLYTDGLIERRDRSVQQTLAELLLAASRTVDDLDRYLDHLLSASPADTDDDTCLLGIQPT